MLVHLTVIDYTVAVIDKDISTLVCNAYHERVMLCEIFGHNPPNSRPASAACLLVQPIQCKAAIAWEAKKPLEVKTVTVDPPGPGEVRIKASRNIHSLCCHALTRGDTLLTLVSVLCADSLHSFMPHRCIHLVRRRYATTPASPAHLR